MVLNGIIPSLSQVQKGTNSTLDWYSQGYRACSALSCSLTVAGHFCMRTRVSAFSMLQQLPVTEVTFLAGKADKGEAPTSTEPALLVQSPCLRQVMLERLGSLLSLPRLERRSIRSKRCCHLPSGKLSTRLLWPREVLYWLINYSKTVLQRFCSRQDKRMEITKYRAWSLFKKLSSVQLHVEKLQP